MKHYLILALIAVSLSFSAFQVKAQPHPNGGGSPNAGNTKVGDQPSAPIGSGTFILITFAIAYSSSKLLEFRAKKANN